MMGSGKAAAGGCADSAAVGRNDTQNKPEGQIQKFVKSLRPVLGQAKRMKKRQKV